MHINNLDLTKPDKRTWKKCRFDQIAFNISERVEPGKTDLDKYVGLEHLDQESIHIKRWGTPADVEGTKLKFYSGDLIFGKRRAYQRKAAVANFDGICSAHAMVLRANTQVVDSQLFPFFIHSDAFMNRAIDISVGSLSPTINWSTLRTQEFLLPPKDQQARLAELLWAGDEVVEKLEVLEQKVQQVAKSIFQKFCKNLESSNLIPVKDLVVDGPRNGFSPVSNAEGIGYKTVSIGAIQNGRFLPEGKIKYAVVEDSILKQFNLRSGDVLVVRGNGNRSLCGKAGLVFKDYPDLFYPDLLIRLRFDPQKVLPEFITFQWNQPENHSRLLQWAKSTNGIYKINGEDLKRHTLFVPPISTQKIIIKHLDSISSCLEMVQKNIFGAGAIQSNLINQIFTSSNATSPLLHSPSHRAKGAASH